MACLALSETIFGSKTEDNKFKKVHLVFYDSNIFPSVHTDRESFDKTVNAHQVNGQTNFEKCFTYIE